MHATTEAWVRLQVTTGGERRSSLQIQNRHVHETGTRLSKGWGTWGGAASGARVSLRVMKMSWNQTVVDGCTILCIYSSPANCILRCLCGFSAVWIIFFKKIIRIIGPP